MSNIAQKKQQQKIAEENVKKTHFNKSEIECLLKKFRQVTKGKLDRIAFRDVLHNDFHMTDDILMDRIFRAFDKDNDSMVSMEEWVRGMSIFLRGTDEEKTKFCFEVYDLNGDGFITKDEMFNLLKTSLVRNPQEEDPEEGTRELVETALKKLDVCGDHKVSMASFEKAVECDSLLMEAFGKCLPDCTCVRFREKDWFHPDKDQDQDYDWQDDYESKSTPRQPKQRPKGQKRPEKRQVKMKGH